MSAAAARPPTKVISSTTVLPSQARDFLSTFILKADTDRHTSSRGDLVLSDQRRIEQALQGVFIPKPIEAGNATETARTELNSPVVTNAAQINSQGDGEVAEEEEKEGEGGGGPSHYALQDEVPIVESQSHSEEGKVDKAKRKAEKKQRLKEEKKQRAEARAKERQ